MKKRLLLVVLLFSSVLASAQQDPQFSQNMHNRLFPNPGVAGSNDAICVALLGRQQWAGFEGRPQTFLFTAHAPVEMLKGGVGLSVVSDKLGVESNTGLKLAYAYRTTVGVGNLGAGIGLGFMQKSLDAGQFNAIDDISLDPSIPDASTGQLKFDLDLGVYYKSPKLYLGLSSTHLSQSSFDDAGATDPNFKYQLSRHYYIMAGYNHDLNAKVVLKPSVFIKSDAASTQLDLNITALYNNFFWAGVSYRVQDAIVPMVGVQKEIAAGDLKIGYSYDVTTSLLAQHSDGSHEIFLSYCFSLVKIPPVQRHKTVRFL